MAIPHIPNNKGIYVRGSHHAQNVFGLNNEFLHQVPKLKFENWVRFNFGPTDYVKNYVEKFLPAAKGNPAVVASLIKSASYPNMDIDTDILNQYNKKRIVQKKINYDPITVTMHDVASGHTLAFWEMYYTYYFRNASNIGLPSKVFNDLKNPTLSYNSGTEFSDFPSLSEGGLVHDTKTHDMFGYINHKSKNQLIRSIELFYSRGKRYSKVILINPRITKFQHDTMDYAGVADTMQLTFTIEYENVIYGNEPYELTDGTTAKNTDDIGADKRPSVHDLPHQSTVKDPTEIPSAAKYDMYDADVPIPKIGTGGTSSALSSVLSGNAEFGNGLIANAAEGILNNTVGNVQGQLGGIVNNIGSDIAGSLVRGIQTGNFSLSPNPIDSAKSVVKNLGGNITGQVTQQATNAIGGAIDSGISSLFTPSADNAQGGSGGGSGQSSGAEGGGQTINGVHYSQAYLDAFGPPAT